METKWVILGITVLMYVLIVIFPGKKSWVSLGAAILLLALSLIPNRVLDTKALNWAALTGHINWIVLMIYVGSLVIAELFIYSRVPAVIADSIIIRSPNVGIAMVAILIMTGLISAFVENVATVLVMAPIALALCAKLKLNPSLFMVGLAVIANLQGTATLVGDPPSMIFADYAGYGFNDFFVYHRKPSIFFAVQVGMIVGALFFYAFFAKSGKDKAEATREKILTMAPSVLLILMIVGLACASFLYGGISLLSGIIVMALGVVGLVWYKFVRRQDNREIVRLVKSLDWDTALFLIGIFIVVGAVSETGLLDDFTALFSRVVGDNVLLGFFLIVAISTVISGFVDNVPYIIIMLPVTRSMAVGLSLVPELYMFALLIGSCMGGNLTPFGASANVVAVGILKKEGVSMNLGQWFKIGIPFTLLTTGASALFVWLVWR
jgi:Na+/H+ antiporter NhaD/arsenite permease-like protein